MELLVLVTTNELGTDEVPEANVDCDASAARYLELVTERAISRWGNHYRVEVAWGSSNHCSNPDFRDGWKDIVHDVFEELAWVITAQAELHIGYTPWLIFANEKYDDIDKSCVLFEQYATARLKLEWPNIQVFMTRHADGTLKDICTETRNVVRERYSLTMAKEAWQIIWDMIGPYSRHRVSKRERYVAPKPSQAPQTTSGLMVAVEDADGAILWIPAEDETEARQILRSGFGVEVSNG